MLVYGVGESFYAYSEARWHAHSGQWFDLGFTIPLVLAVAVAATWEAPEAERKLPRLGFAARAKSCILLAARKFLSQRRRNGSIDILDLVRCNRCMSGRLEKRGDRAVCSACSAEFPVLNAAIIDFTAEQPPVRGETA